MRFVVLWPYGGSTSRPLPAVMNELMMLTKTPFTDTEQRHSSACEYIHLAPGPTDVKPGEITSFPRAVKLEPEETMVFAWIVYESRQHRDRVNEPVMKDPESLILDPKIYALRRQAHVLGRIQGARRGLSLAGRRSARRPAG